MSDNFDEIEVWELDFSVFKGGPGSGEHVGHPFRGNGHSGGVVQAGHHNPRGDEGRDHHYHYDQATLHTHAGLSALHAGDYGSAMRHFNEAARHGAWGAKKLLESGEDRSLHQAGKQTYAIAHHAGDLAQIANQSTRALAKAVKEGADPTIIAGMSQKATADQANASKAADTLSSNISEISGMRLSNAVGRVNTPRQSSGQ